MDLQADIFKHIDIQTLAEMSKRGIYALEDMVATFNAAQEKYQLSQECMLYMLAQFSAGHIHEMQLECTSPAARDEVEDVFHDALEFYLGEFDMQELEKEQSRMMS